MKKSKIELICKNTFTLDKNKFASLFNATIKTKTLTFARMSEKKMRNNSKNSGTDFVRVLWGKDFCQFCGIKEDLMDLLVPYLKTGLEDNELCILPHKSTGCKRSP